MQSQHNPITILFIVLGTRGNNGSGVECQHGYALLLVSIQLRHRPATSHVESIFDDL
jgi:hypothetical protein